MSELTKYYAYLHARPNTTDINGVFYVGKGTGKRAFDMSQRNPYHKNVTNKYGRENILVGVIPCSSEQIALDLEYGLMKCLHRANVNLSNLTYELGAYVGKSYVRTEDDRRCQSERIKDYLSKNPEEMQTRIDRCKWMMQDEKTKEKQKEGIAIANSRPDVREKRSKCAIKLHTEMKEKHLESQRTPEIRRIRRENMLGTRVYNNGYINKMFKEGFQDEGFCLGRLRNVAA